MTTRCFAPAYARYCSVSPTSKSWTPPPMLSKGLHRPDVVLLDLNMPGLSGIESLQLLQRDLPDTAVIMLTVSEDVDELTRALREGVCGYLLKNMEADALATMIRRAAAGESVVAESMTQRLIAQIRTPVLAEDTAPPPSLEPRSSPASPASP